MKNHTASGNILVVDDTMDNLRFHTRVLTDHGYQVRAAKTGMEALSSVKNAPPDLILLDVKLPDMNGFDVCKRLKSDEASKDIPVIFLSVLDETGDKVKGFESGGVDYITKPFQPVELATRIQTHLAISRMRIQLEEQSALLSASETSFRNLFDNMSEGVALHEMIYDGRQKPVNYRILSINPAFSHHTGLNKELVIGKLATEAYETDLPPYLEVYAQTADSGKPHSFETWFPPLKKHFRISVSSPKQKQFVTVFEDITERKQIEQDLRINLTKYKVLFDSFPLGITISDSGGQIVESNPLAENLLGLSFEEQAKRTISGGEWRIVRPDGTPMPASEYASVRALSEQCRVDDVEMGIVKSDNRITWINVSAAPIPLEGFGVVITYHDISGRKQAETELNLKNEILLTTIAEKDKFFSIIAHDLRNPFSSFLGFTQMMAEELPTLTLDQIQKIAVNMRKSASNLYDLLENLLEWSLLQRGMTTLEPIVFPLMSRISESMSMVIEPANQKEITIHYEIPDGSEVYADENMFGTIIRNLASNAVKFTPKGGKIDISAKRVNENLVEISVKDNGIGMTGEMIANLFRLDKNTNRKGTEGEPSTGLGLIICKDFIEKHGGRLWVESEEGKGSTFYFTLPLDKKRDERNDRNERDEKILNNE